MMRSQRNVILQTEGVCFSECPLVSRVALSNFACPMHPSSVPQLRSSRRNEQLWKPDCPYTRYTLLIHVGALVFFSTADGQYRRP